MHLEDDDLGVTAGGHNTSTPFIREGAALPPMGKGCYYHDTKDCVCGEGEYSCGHRAKSTWPQVGSWWFFRGQS